MKKGFTIIEVSILFVIFLIVAFLVAPLSLDDTMQAKNTSRWRNVQQDFSNISYSLNSQLDDSKLAYAEVFESIFNNEIKSKTESYKISYMNGSNIASVHKFDNYNTTYSNAVVAFKLFDEPQDGLIGMLMYDVNGKTGPNVWGRDVFGLDIYADSFVPFGKGKSLKEQKQDCSRQGTGLACSNYYLIGGNFD